MTAKERFIETWASHCGAPRSVFVGHLEKMLAEEIAAARHVDLTTGDGEPGQFSVTLKTADLPRRRPRVNVCEEEEKS